EARDAPAGRSTRTSRPPAGSSGGPTQVEHSIRRHCLGTRDRLDGRVARVRFLPQADESSFGPYIGMEKCCSTASDWNVGIKARKGQPNRVFIAGSELGALCAFQTGLVVQLYSKNLLERRRAALEHVVLRVGAARVAGAVATRARGDPRGENARPPRR